MPSGLGMAHGEKKKMWGAFWWHQAGSARWAHSSNSDGDFLQAGSNGSAETSLKQQGSNQCSWAGYLLCLCQAPGRSDWLLVREWDRVFGD